MFLPVLRLTGCMLKRWPEWSRVVKNRQGRLLAVVRRAGPMLGGLQTPGKCWSRCWCSPSNCSDPFWWMMNSFLCFQLEAGHQRRGEEEWCGLGWENCCCVLFVIISQQRMPGLLSHSSESLLLILEMGLVTPQLPDIKYNFPQQSRGDSAIIVNCKI